MTLTEIKEVVIPSLTLWEKRELAGLLAEEEATAGTTEDVEEAWKEESRRRIAELESGEVQGIPVETAMAELWRRTHA